MGYYKDLIVWQKAMTLVEKIYKIEFPTNEEFGLQSQIRRSSISIPSNIAEGNGRESIKEYIRFLRVAKGSLFELQTQLDLTFRLDIIGKELFESLHSTTNEIAAMLSSLIKKLNTSIP